MMTPTTMDNIGIVGLDTSHGEAYAEAIESHPDLSLSTIWDDRTIRNDEYVAEFCANHDVNEVERPTEMVDQIDGVMILSVDWNRHRDLAVPFLERGVPTAIDKPVAGSLTDLEAIEDASTDVPLFGGSAVPYVSKLEAIEVTADRTLAAVGYNDPFYYGVHLVDTVCSLVDGRWSSVSTTDDPGTTVDVTFEDGSFATLRLDSPTDASTFSFLTLENDPTVVTVESTPEEMRRMYRNYVDAFHRVIVGELDVTDRVLTAGSLLLAVQAALDGGGRITPESDGLKSISIDSGEFVESYAPYY